ncbi:MAG: nucleotidyltransferase domain-containing protein [Schwartzia sp.]|nr:nucleotidyltransferase domain-containing protein [Schwartzia sp. (in: firmicutes)]MBR5163102.1 nucleotidyltransferase domain-containing protein [Schwartzia sp. (in: firmicutes)]
MLSIAEIKRRIMPICKKYDIKRAYLFGSYARGDASEGSDVDLRIDKGASQKLRGLLAVSALRLELVDVLQKNVDLITALPDDDLHAIFRKHVLSDEVIVYDS